MLGKTLLSAGILYFSAGVATALLSIHMRWANCSYPIAIFWGVKIIFMVAGSVLGFAQSCYPYLSAQKKRSRIPGFVRVVQ